MRKDKSGTIYQKVLRGFIYALTPLLFCSYYPLLSLGSNASTNFEFSLPEIWLILFFVVTLPLITAAWRFYRQSHRYVKMLIVIVLGFWLYAGLSLLWTPNFLRGFLTFGLLSLTIYAAFMLYFILVERFDDRARRRAVAIFLVSAAVFALFGVVQCLLDVAGVPSTVTLLCDGCTYTAFGFPRASGLAIEPQFMGNLLLAPTLLALYLSIHKNTPHRRLVGGLSVFLVFALCLTFSRGAIYALAVGIVLMIVAAWVWGYGRERLIASKKRQQHSKACKNDTILYSKPNKYPNRGVENVEKFSNLWLLIVLPLVGLVLALGAQGTMAVFSPTNDTFISGVTKSIHQLTLGVIDWRVQPGTTSEATDSTFNGYVEESTDVRLNLSEVALDIWDDSAYNLLSGVGLGGAGVALQTKTDTLSSKEIVQNQFISILLELGIVGAVLILLFLVYLVKIFNCQKFTIFFLALLVAYLISLFFFAGLPNALHIYLFPAILLGTLPFCAKRSKVKT